MEEVTTVAGNNRDYLARRWHLPPQNPNFMGRKKELDKIKQYLIESKFVVCYGLGGVGKTQLVTEYIYQYGDEYQYVFLIPAENAELIEMAYMAIGRAFKFVDDKTPSSHAMAIVRQKLSDSANILMYFDNAPDYPTLEPYIPIGTHVVVTSRHTEWPTHKDIPLGVFSPKRSVKYFRKILAERASLYSDKNINLLIETLGRLPLALAHAAAYVYETGIGIEKYLELFESKKSMLLSKNIFPEGENNVAVYVTWDVTMELIGQKSQLAPKLLHLCAYLYGGGIPQEVLRRYSDNAENNLGEEFFEEALGLLRSYSMLTVTPPSSEVPSVWVHNLVQDVLQTRDQNGEQQKWLDAIALSYKSDAYTCDRAGLEEYFAFSLNVMPHVKRVMGLAKKLNYSSVPLIQFCMLATLVYPELSFMEDELKLATQLSDETERSRYTAFAQEAIGLRFFVFFQKAEECFLETLALRLQLEHTAFASEIMSSYTCLALLYYVNGAYENSIDFFESAFDVIEKTEDKKLFTAWMAVFQMGVPCLLKKSPYREKNTKLFSRWVALLPALSGLGDDLIEQLSGMLRWEGAGGSVEFGRSGKLYVSFLLWVVQGFQDDKLDELNVDFSALSTELSSKDAESLVRQYGSLSSVMNTTKGLTTGINAMLDNLINPASSVASPCVEVSPMNESLRGVLQPLRSMTGSMTDFMGQVQDLENGDIDDSRFMDSLFGAMGGLTDMLKGLPGLFEQQEEHSGADVPEWQKNMRRLVLDSSVNVFSEKMREMEEMKDEMHEIENNIRLNKNVIEYFERALKSVLAASQRLKESFGGYREWMMQLPEHDVESVHEECLAGEIIEETFIAPVRSLLQRCVTPKRILVLFQDQRDSLSEEFVEIVNQDDTHFSLLIDFITEHEKIRQRLIHAILERFGRLAVEGEEQHGALTERTLEVAFSVVNDFSFLKVIDNLLCVERNLFRDLKKVSYILAAFPAPEDFETFDVCVLSELGEAPDTYFIESEVLQQYQTSVQKLILSSENLLQAFGAAMPSGIEKSLEAQKSGFVDATTVMRDQLKMLQKNTPVELELFFLWMRGASLTGQVLVVDELRKILNVWSVFSKRNLFIFSIMKKKFNDHLFPKGFVGVETEATEQSSQFYEGFPLMFKQILREIEIVVAILDSFPSQERLQEILKDDRVHKGMLEEITGESEGAMDDVFDTLDESDPLYRIVLERMFREKRRTPQQQREILIEVFDRDGVLPFASQQVLDRVNLDCELLRKSQKHAIESRAQDNLEAVISQYELMVVISPFDIQLSCQLAEFYDVLSRNTAFIHDEESTLSFRNKAKKMFEKSLAISPDSKTLVAYANFLCHLEQYDEARIFLQIVLQCGDEQQAALRFDSILKYLLPQRLHGCIEMDGYVEIPLGMFAHYLCIRCCWEQDDVEKANQMFTVFLREIRTLQNPVLYYLLAECSDLLGQYAVAIRANALVHYLRATEYYEKNKRDEAIQCYEQCLLSDPEMESVHHNLACLYHARGDIDLAKRNFELALVQSRLSTQSEYGYFLYRQQEYAQAIPYFTHVLLVEEDQSSLVYGACDVPCLDEVFKNEFYRYGNIHISSIGMAFYGIIRCYHALELNQEVEEKLTEFRQFVESAKEVMYWRLLIATFDVLGKSEECEDCKEMLSAVMFSMQTESEARLVGRLGLMPAVNEEADKVLLIENERKSSLGFQ